MLDNFKANGQQVFSISTARKKAAINTGDDGFDESDPSQSD